MNGDEAITLGEVARSVKRLEATTAEIRSDIRSLKFLDPNVYAVAHQALIDRINTLETERIKPIENRLSFIGRTVFTAIVTLCGSGILAVLVATR